MLSITEKLKIIKNNFIQSINAIIKNRNIKINKIIQKQDEEKIKNIRNNLK
jgi:hypothetical protein